MLLEDTRGNRKKSEVNIGQMEIDDIGSVYHLGEKLFTSEEFPILYRTWDAYEVTDHFTSDPDYCLVAEAQGSVIGFILATTIEKEGTAWKKYGYVSWIGVDETFQRTNLGLRLYKRLEERFKEDGVRMIIADTEANNEGAIAFFKAIGFSPSRQHLWLTKTLRRPIKKDAKSNLTSSKTQNHRSPSVDRRQKL
ncbi:MAG TPA: GNAT family N-acetyltransferase [Dehalococcoidia bacterium]|nr:GNAT family N-acetyltransferase [Dehalococcoidia bacterium]